jgi:hypothetical protein
LSIGEINRCRKQTESTSKSPGLSWTGDFESLKKNFVAESLSESSHASTEIEDLRQGQQSNEEAIQALSDTIGHMGAIVSQFQVFMDKNNKSIGEKKSYRSIEYTNLHAGHVYEMAEMCGRDANDA